MTTEATAATPVATTTGRCPNCGNDVEAGGRGRGRVFCPATEGRKACRELFANRAKSQGAPLLPLVLAWTETRHAKPGSREAEICKKARAEITAIARQFLDEAKAEGRPPAADYAETLFRSGERYMDRTRR